MASFHNVYDFIIQVLYVFITSNKYTILHIHTHTHTLMDIQSKKPVTVILEGKKVGKYREDYFYFVTFYDLNVLILIHYFYINGSF